jgi:uncharacterized cupin superfamily protein/ribosomal protein S18 acetylase RimI-like enzyme
MKIEFKPLSESHFPLLLKWLESNRIKQWWDQDIIHTEESIKEKYTSYTQGYKIKNAEKKPISAFIIYADHNPVGYIQLYNAYDFDQIVDLPKSLGKIDFFIGEEEYLGKGIARKALIRFNYQDFDYIFVDPDIDNFAAIRTYESAGFRILKEHTNEVFMIKENFVTISADRALSYNWGDNCIGYWLKKKGAFTVIEEIMPPNTSEIKHYHQKSEQFFYCLEGELYFELDDKNYILYKGDGIEVKAGITHKISNQSKANARFLVVSSPSSHGDRINLGKSYE